MDFNVMLEPIRATLTQFGLFLPKLVAALGWFLGAWILARLARFAVDRHNPRGIVVERDHQSLAR